MDRVSLSRGLADLAAEIDCMDNFSEEVRLYAFQLITYEVFRIRELVASEELNKVLESQGIKPFKKDVSLEEKLWDAVEQLSEVVSRIKEK